MNEAKEEMVPGSLTKKTYLEHKENKLKKIKDKSKQSLGTMGSR
jgi:thermostable 8-oxoguanine DNA glycosylase